MVVLIGPYFFVLYPGANGVGIGGYLAFLVKYMYVNVRGWFVPPTSVVAVLVEQVMLTAKALVCNVSFYM